MATRSHIREQLYVAGWVVMAYLACVRTGGVSGFYMATMAAGGNTSVVALVLLALLWMATGAMALATGWQGRFEAHRAWTVRSYALTFGAVTLRVYLSLSATDDTPF